jgi:hypothetical protein
MEKSVPQLNAETQPANTKRSIADNDLSTPAVRDAGTTGTTPAGKVPEKPLTSATGNNKKPDGSESTAGVEHEPPEATNVTARQSTAASTSNADKFFSMQQRFPLQVFEHESAWQKFSHLGPTFASLASLVLTLFVWNNAAQLSKQQLALDEKQAQLQEKQVEAELSDIRIKFLNDLTAKEETKKVHAEIGLAGHGAAALPVVYFALGVEQGQIRNSAVNVFYRMFQASSSFPDRDALLTELMKRMMSPNKNLRTGVVQSLVKVGPLLNLAERQKVIAFLESKVPPQNICHELEGRSMVKEAATFFWSGDASSIPYLVSIARNPGCGDGWMQAMVKLGEVAAKQPQQRSELLKIIDQVLTETLPGLRERVSDETLLEGGFKEFLEEGKVTASFTDFEQKVKEELNRLKEILSEQ